MLLLMIRTACTSAGLRSLKWEQQLHRPWHGGGRILNLPQTSTRYVHYEPVAVRLIRFRAKMLGLMGLGVRQDPGSHICVFSQTGFRMSGHIPR